MPSQPNAGHDIDGLVRREILKVLTTRHRTVPTIAPGDALNAVLGLSSSDVAGLVSHVCSCLSLGTAAIPVTDVKTVGDLCGAAREALKETARGAAEPDPLEVARRRAQARRLDGRAR